jgi:ketosteroid isomerase-like protein
MPTHAIRAAAICLTLLTTGANASDRSIVDDLEFRSFLADFEEGTRRFMNGDTALWKRNVSRRTDVTIMGAWGAYEKGWPEVSARYDWAGARFVESGAKLEVEYLAAWVSGDLAVTNAIERAEVKIAGQDKTAPMTLRVTHVFRKDDGTWKLMLRHADPLMRKTAPDAVLKP